MQKIIYEYDLDKILINETIEKFNKLDNSVILPQFYTEIKPVFNGDTHFAIFDENSKTWNYKEFSPLGVFYNKQSMVKIEIKSKYNTDYFADLYTEIKPLPTFNDGTTQAFNNTSQAWEYITKGSQLLEFEWQNLTKEKVLEIQKDYKLAQTVLLINGRVILINIMGADYADLQREFNKSSWRKDQLATFIIKDVNDNKRYKLTIPRSFGKFLLSKIEKMSADNYKKKEIALQKIEQKELTLAELSVLKVDFIYDNEININVEANSYINDNYFITKYPKDIEFVINSNQHFFTPING